MIPSSQNLLCRLKLIYKVKFYVFTLKNALFFKAILVDIIVNLVNNSKISKKIFNSHLNYLAFLTERVKIVRRKINDIKKLFEFDEKKPAVPQPKVFLFLFPLNILSLETETILLACFKLLVKSMKK